MLTLAAIGHKLEAKVLYSKSGQYIVMVSANFATALRSFARRRPFRSFTVELISGDHFEVDHPEALVFRGGLAVFIDGSGVPYLFDHEGVSQLFGGPTKPRRREK